MDNEYLFKILRYLPSQFLESENQDFVEYLKHSATNNWKNIFDNNGNIISSLHQISFKSFYDLYITFIFIKIWQIKKFDNISFGKYFQNLSKDIKNRVGTYNTPFHISIVNEKEIFNFLRILDFNSNAIDKFSSLVKIRDHCSHPCGIIEYSKEELEKEISKILDYCNKISAKSEKITNDFFKQFLLNFDFDLIEEYLNSRGDEFLIKKYKEDLYGKFEEDFVRKNYLSNKDIELICNFDINGLSRKDNFEKIKIVFDLFNEFYCED